MSNTSEVTIVRLIASYQMMGDSEGRSWMTEALSIAQDKGDIKAFEVTGSHTGQWGIQFITFTVDVELGDRFKAEHGYAETKEIGTALLNEVVGDSDIEVHWVAPVMA